MKQSIAVLGGGNGAHAVAADLTFAGYEVKMFEFPQFKANIQKVLETREIVKEGVSPTGVARIHLATTDISKAVKGVSIILVIMPAFGHRPIATAIASYLEDGQILALFPGSGGTLEIHQVLKEKGIRKDVTLCEGVTLPYGARMVEPGKVRVFTEAVILPTGVFPASRTDEVISKLKTLYKTIQPAKDVLEAAINNPNPIVHPIATLLSATRIEYSKGDFYLYVEGMTPSVARVIEALTREKIAICDAMGWNLYHWNNLDPRGYHLGNSVEECNRKILNTSMDCAFGQDSIQAGMKMRGPENMKDRFITEDVPYGMVFISSLANMLQIPTPVHDSVIELCSTINGENYWETGRNVEKLGIKGMDAIRLKKFLADREI
ncbi:MAG: dehydrogenase [Deltaproteobacteria bacterium]|nr:dehydrogenase [Deltaproteobacteria bacterium]